MRALIAAMILLVCTSAVAPARTSCHPIEVAKAEANDIIAKLGGGELVELSGKEATSYLDSVNSVPPETHLAAKSVMLLAMPGRGVVIGLVIDGNVCIAGRVGMDVHEKALKAAKGEDT